MTGGRTPVLALEELSKTYGDTVALEGVSFTVPRGQFLSVMGPSGCGKTTLLNLIAGLEIPSRGRVVVAGNNLAGLGDDARTDLRLGYVGFIFQNFNLLPTFTVVENVAVPLELRGLSPRAAREQAAETLDQVGVDLAAHGRLPTRLSGGQQQRVAIARALVTEPQLLLADEPTGNLDSHTGNGILELLAVQVMKRNLTVVMVTHNTSAAMMGSRIIELRDGRVIRDVGQEETPASRVVPLRREG